MEDGRTVPLPWRLPGSGLETVTGYSNTASNEARLSGQMHTTICAMVFTSKNVHVQEMMVDQVQLGLPRDWIGRHVGKNGVLAANSKQWLQTGPFERTGLAALCVLHTSTAHNIYKIRSMALNNKITCTVLWYVSIETISDPPLPFTFSTYLNKLGCTSLINHILLTTIVNFGFLYSNSYRRNLFVSGIFKWGI